MKSLILVLASVITLSGCASTQTPSGETEAEALSSFLMNEQTKRIDQLTEREMRLEELVQLLIGERKIEHAQALLSGGSDEKN